MKSLIGVGWVFLFLGCGIMSVVFGLPDRFIKRAVKAEELVGEWKITSDSEEKLNKFRETFPDWPGVAPFKTIQLSKDRTCQIKIESQWLPNYVNSTSGMPHDEIPQDILANNILSCSWGIAKTRVFSDSGREEVQDLEISIDYPNNYRQTYGLFIYEENEALILWTFIGDPDDFVPQDFVKSSK